jgi:DNA-damage-inducible protein D
VHLLAPFSRIHWQYLVKIDWRSRPNRDIIAPQNKESALEINPRESVFEKIKRTREDGLEYWQSREFSEICGYEDYRNFEAVIGKAKESCKNSGHAIEDHFGEFTEMVTLGSGAQREVEVVLLSRYACYLIIQNADPAKEVIALGQTYFAIQTRRAELSDDLIEDNRRLLLRKNIKEHNAQLAEAAKACGVVQPLDYAVFQNHGYKGLYGGLTAQELHARRKLKKSEKILDHMTSAELAANLFRATQAEQKLRRESPRDKNGANAVHLEVGKKVRNTIKELGGTMPEELPAVENISQVEKRIAGKKKKDVPPLEEKK